MKEVFVDIKGYEGLYQVSNFGNVKSLDRRVKNRWGYWIRKGKAMSINKSNRYFSVNLFIDWAFKCCKIHRLVAVAFIHNPESKPQINHIDGNKMNNRSDNLEWVTQAENMQHAKRIGLRPNFKGEKNPAAILTEQKVIEIRHKYFNTKTSMRKLAVEYNVCSSTIFGVVNNNFWNNVKKTA